MRIILLGAPGAGKGTQAENIQSRLHIPAVSTGAILRDAIKQETELGESAKSYIDVGKLVPDRIVVALIRERLSKPDCENGYILDGYPRTIAQAEALEACGIELDVVLSIEVPDDEIERRLTGRRICENCGHSYHMLYNPPRRESSCDNCGGALVRRADDEPETVRNRLRIYHESTEPLKGFYQRTGKLKTVVSHEDVAVTTQRTNEALGI